MKPSRTPPSRWGDRLGVDSSGVTRRSAGTATAADDEPEGSTTGLRHETSGFEASRWRLAAVLPALRRPSCTKGAATTMFSISFFPWKMEAFGYYSSPWAAAAWVPDTASMRCQLCLAAFTLLRRRHHCRLCGHLVCNDCSLPRTFLPFSDSARSQHHMIRDGEPQRTCSACAGTLHNMAAQRDPRVRKLAVPPPPPPPRQWRARFAGRRESDRDCKCELGRRLASAGSVSVSVASESAARRLSASLAEELDEILRALSLSRSPAAAAAAATTTTGRLFVVSSQWLERWLCHARGGPASPSPGPVANYSLLDFANGALGPRPGLVQSVDGAAAAGDFHVVSEGVWLAFLRLYGGGPSIQAARTGAGAGAGAESPRSGSPRARASASDWLISELSVAPETDAGARHLTSASLPVTAPRAVKATKAAKAAKTAKAAKATKAASMSSGSFRAALDARDCADGDALKRWSLARARGSRPPATLPADAWAAKASATRRAEPPCARSTIVAVSAFAHAATEARRRSALSLSRHPSARLIGSAPGAGAA